MTRFLLLACLALTATACGPSGRADCDPENLQVDPENCGVCGRACGADQACVQAVCTDSACNVGTLEPCYSGPPGTEGIGSCIGGMRTCTSAGTWGICVGEALPRQEVCGNGIDENCSGEADENVDLDGDGFTTCDGDCCDSPGQCTSPELVNPGAFESNGNSVDDDCDGVADNALAACDAGILSNTSDAMDFVRAIDVCATSTESSPRWGVIDARLTVTDGTTPLTMNAQKGHAVRNGFGTGTGVMSPRGDSLIVLSSGAAADANDTNPAFETGVAVTHNQSSSYPSDWFAANGNMLPNVMGCPNPTGANANDAVMLTTRIRVPSNAKSFSVKINFFSHEYPEYTCTVFNDFFVVLLDSMYAGTPANPTDKNLAFYTSPAMVRYPVGVNLAYGNTGLFTSCINGTGGCSGSPQYPFQIDTCTDSGFLPGTGFDVVTNSCGTTGQTSGGGTGWLTTSGNVVGREIITLRFAIWDTSDSIFDSTVLIDDFQWSVDAATPGTVIE